MRGRRCCGRSRGCGRSSTNCSARQPNGVPTASRSPSTRQSSRACAPRPRWRRHRASVRRNSTCAPREASCRGSATSRRGPSFWHFGGHANPHRTVQAYAWAVARQGGTVLQHTPALGIKVSAGRAVAVVTPQGEIGCDAVLIAAGPGTAGLAATVGVRLPLALARVEMLATEPMPRLAHGGVDGHGLYGRESLRGNLLYGGGPHEWLDRDDEAPPPRRVGPVMAGLTRRLVELFPRLGHARVIRAWSGVVENTPDGRPVLERLAEPRNVTIATMSSVGFGLSPAAGGALAELVTEGRCSFANLSSLALARFAGLPEDWRERQGWTPAR
ncbi:MAG: FAD-binding oxidoreductase [Acetobacteraceae bacterium]|nr:FAD-binding oxidoreductase [Acetobacteraceae bacterium]